MLGSIPLENKKLTPLQTFLWPIFPHETRLTLYLSFLIFLILGSNTLLFPFHDTFLFSAPNSGVEVLGFVRILGELPFGIIFIITFTWLHNKFKKPEIVIILYFFITIFFIIFSFFILPNNSFFTIDPDIITELMEDYPRLKWIFPIYGNWTITIFFVVTSTWTSIAHSQLFWQTANHFTKTEQASRLYPILIISGGLGGTFFAFILAGLTRYAKTLQFETSHETLLFTLQFISTMLIIISLIIIITFKKLYRDLSLIPKEIRTPVKEREKKVPSPSAFEGFHYLFHSSYLSYIFLTVLSAGIIYQLISFLWKSEFHTYTINVIGYNELLINYALWNSIILVVFALGTKSFIHKWGWQIVAYLTPLISFLTALPFLILLFLHHINNEFTIYFNIDPHYLLGVVGSFQSMAMGASLSCLFSPTKEMAYIPLEEDMKVKGKATADVLGRNTAAAGGGMIQEGLLSWSGGIDLTIVPQVIGFLITFFVTWFYATYALGKKYTNLIESKQK